MGLYFGWHITDTCNEILKYLLDDKYWKLIDKVFTSDIDDDVTGDDEYEADDEIRKLKFHWTWARKCYQCIATINVLELLHLV